METIGRAQIEPALIFAIRTYRKVDNLVHYTQMHTRVAQQSLQGTWITFTDMQTEPETVCKHNTNIKFYMRQDMP